MTDLQAARVLVERHSPGEIVSIPLLREVWLRMLDAAGADADARERPEQLITTSELAHRFNMSVPWARARFAEYARELSPIALRRIGARGWCLRPGGLADFERWLAERPRRGFEAKQDGSVGPISPKAALRRRVAAQREQGA